MALTYQNYIIPMIRDHLLDHANMILMQDHVPAYKARSTFAMLEELGIPHINWPACSPDLNPIENLWNYIKDWIALNYPVQMSERQLRNAIEAAWNAIPDDYIRILFLSMPRHIQACLAAEGGYIKY
jgi:hypothetical protein